MENIIREVDHLTLVARPDVLKAYRGEEKFRVLGGCRKTALALKTFMVWEGVNVKV